MADADNSTELNFCSSLPRPSRISEKTCQPIHWPNLKEELNYVRPLSTSNGEFWCMKNACKEFGIKVTGVSRVENTALSKRYYDELKRHEDGEANEVYLFHGTPMDSLLNILKEGLDLRESKDNNHFGSYGIYFSDNPRKAASYVRSKASTGEMLVCRVMLGKTMVYNVPMPTIRKPPAGYHSVKGTPRKHAEYVVYENARTLVEYIVEYDNTKFLNKYRQRLAKKREEARLAGKPMFGSDEDEFKPEVREGESYVESDDSEPEPESDPEVDDPTDEKKVLEAKIAKLRKEYLKQLIDQFKRLKLSIQQQSILYRVFEDTYGPNRSPPKKATAEGEEAAAAADP